MYKRLCYTSHKRLYLRHGSSDESVQSRGWCAAPRARWSIQTDRRCRSRAASTSGGSVGKAAQAHHTGILLTIDEIQYLERNDFGALVLGLHRAAQLSLPVMITGAGLPSLLALAGEAKSYAERMFYFPSIGSLAVSEAREAIAAPAAKEGVQWEDSAIQVIVERTQGYPYFLQEFAKQAWDAAPGPVHIRLSDVKASLKTTMAELDAGFFRIRFDRTTDSERAYLRAMASLGPGPFATSAVTKVLRRTTNQLGPVRD